MLKTMHKVQGWQNACENDFFLCVYEIKFMERNNNKMVYGKEFLIV